MDDQSYGSQVSITMDWDDEGPPDLVPSGAELEPEEKPVKVPITIVTGVFFRVFMIRD